MINHIEIINQILDKEEKISKKQLDEAIQKVDMEEEKRRELRHILISYIPYGDLEYEVKDYENIINFIGNYFKEKDYQYVIAREPIINEKLKEDVIPISVIQNKKSEIEKQLQEYEESDMEQDDDYFFDVNAFQGEIAVLNEILKKGNK